MTTVRNLMGTGVSALSAQATATGLLTNSLTAAGSTQGTALAMPSDYLVFTTVAASTGTILPANCVSGDWYTVVNHGANALLVYPPTGGKIANGSTNAGLSVGAGKTCQVMCIDPLTFAASVSA
jgi:hypothetical protein